MPVEMINLDALGPRICIIGPSSSGKSTLANLIGRKTGRPIIHLDQLAHHANTDWERRDDAEFVVDHDKIIQEDRWVIEGNYSVCMPKRFGRATSVIWLDPSLVGCTLRCVMRSIGKSTHRVGKLHGSKKDFTLTLLKYTWFNYPANKIEYRKILLDSFEGRLITINNMRDLNHYTAHWGL